MCAKFYCNKTFNFKVMIKKPISDEKFRISLRQSWKKRVGTLDPLYCNYPSARDCKDIWGNVLFSRSHLTPHLSYPSPPPINQCWPT